MPRQHAQPGDGPRHEGPQRAADGSRVLLAVKEAPAEHPPRLGLDQRALGAIERFGAQALVLSLGLDALATDPEALSKLGLAVRDFGTIGRRVGGALAGLPTVVVQEGGYDLENVPAAVVHMLDGLAAGAAADADADADAVRIDTEC